MSNSDQVRTYPRAESVVFLKTTGLFGGLSNMSGGYPIRVNGIRFLTSEALYQACRFPHLPDVQRMIIGENSPMTAKMKSKPYRKDSRPDWDRVRIKVMRWCLRVKLAQNWEMFSELLLRTGDRPIVEESRRDDFWGAKPQNEQSLVGMNVLGRLLMELRESVKARGPAGFQAIEAPDIPEFLLLDQPIGAVHAQRLDPRDASTPSAGPTTHHEAQPTPAKQMCLFDSPSLRQESASSFITSPSDGKTLFGALTPYPAMRDSGLPWLRMMPDHWQLRRMKTLLRERREKGHPGEPLLAATQSQGVVRKDQFENRTVLAMKDLHLLKLVRTGDFVISLRSFQGGIEYARHQGIISPAYTVLFPAHGKSHGYLAWLFKSSPFIASLSLYVTGIRQGQNIDYEKLGRTELPFPPLPEQQLIARFLDHADRNIQRYIRAKRKLIKLLEEQKQAIIHRAITRGLTPHVRLRPSGVKWLGDVPEYWAVMPLKSRVGFREGPGIMRTDFRESGVPLLRVACLLSSHDPLSGCNYLDPEAVGRKWAHFRVQPGDYILNASTSATTVMLREADPKTFGAVPYTGLIRLWAKDDTVDMGYVNLLFQSPQVQRQLLVARSGVGIAHFGPTHLKRVWFALPPRHEQNAIVRALELETRTLTTAVEAAMREIDLLREYRTRLIADVVKGRVDVREAASQLPEAVEDSLSQLEVDTESDSDNAREADTEAIPEDAEA